MKLAAQLEIGRLQSKCAQLESALAARDLELSLADARYRKYAEKAKEVIKNLDPRVLSGNILFEKPSGQITCPTLVQLRCTNFGN